MISPLLLNDGHCPFCHFWWQFLLKHDTKKHFHYTPLSGETSGFFEHKGIEVPKSIDLV